MTFETTVREPGTYKNEAVATYSAGGSVTSNATWHRWLLNRTVQEEFHEYSGVSPNKGQQLQADNNVTVAHGSPYNRSTTPPATITKNGATYQYYGVLVNGVFDGQPLSTLPNQLISSVTNNSNVVTYLYRKTYVITEAFKSIPTEAGDPNLSPPQTNGVSSPTTIPDLWSGDSFNPQNPPNTLVYDGSIWSYRGYKLDGGSLTNGNPPNFSDINADHAIVYYYERGGPASPTLHLRQIVLDYDGSTTLPYKGYFNLEHDSRITNVTTDSDKLGGSEVDFRSIDVTLSGSDMVYLINNVLPQYYDYDGFIATTSYTVGDHDPLSRVSTPAQADFDGETEIWVTVYIRPRPNPGRHDWSFRVNDFGVIYPTP
jgi:hypothetical protein